MTGGRPRRQARRPDAGGTTEAIISLPPRADRRNGRIRWFQLWIQDLRGDTAHLSPEALGAYLRLLLEQLRRQEPIPNNQNVLRRVTGVQRNWKAIHDELLTILEIRGDTISAPVAEAYIAKFRQRSAINQRNAARRYCTSAEIEDAADD